MSDAKLVADALREASRGSSVHTYVASSFAALAAEIESRLAEREYTTCTITVHQPPDYPPGVTAGESGSAGGPYPPSSPRGREQSRGDQHSAHADVDAGNVARPSGAPSAPSLDELPALREQACGCIDGPDGLGLVCPGCRLAIAANRKIAALEAELCKSETDRANMVREAHGWKALVEAAERECDEARAGLVEKDNQIGTALETEAFLRAELARLQPKPLDDAEAERLAELAAQTFYKMPQLSKNLAGISDWKRTVCALAAVMERYEGPKVRVSRAAVVSAIADGHVWHFVRMLQDAGVEVDDGEVVT